MPLGKVKSSQLSMKPRRNEDNRFAFPGLNPDTLRR